MAERRLGYVLKRFPRVSETFIASELIELERQGERVTVFAISRPEEPFVHGFLDELRAQVIYLPHRPSKEPLRVAGAVARTLRSSPSGWLRAARLCLWPPRLVGLRRLLQATVLREEMKRAQVDHAHAHFATAAARLANLAWRMGGPRYSVTAHAKDIYHEENRRDHLVDKLGNAFFVATVSEANRRYLSALLGTEDRVHVVPNSVSMARLRAFGARQPEPWRVLTVARLIEKKGLGDLIEACRLLREGGAPVSLEVVGDGPLRSDLEAQATAAGLEATFHGALPQEQVFELFRHAVAFCLPCVVAADGDRDGLPTSVLEAMALGVPVVTTALNGLADVVIDGETGILAPEHDPQGLANSLTRVLGDEHLARRLSEGGRHQVEAYFSSDRSAALLRGLFPRPG